MDPLLDAPHGRRLGMGEGLPAFRLGVPAHRFDYPCAQGPLRASEGQDPRRERGAPAATVAAAVPLRVLVLLGLAVAPSGFAVEPTPGVAAVASYSGPDRSERLIAAAKREGELMLYSSITQEDQLKLVADFR